MGKEHPGKSSNLQEGYMILNRPKVEPAIDGRARVFRTPLWRPSTRTEFVLDYDFVLAKAVHLLRWKYSLEV
jgi:hypothetical protein